MEAGSAGNPQPPALSARGVTKRFGPLAANDDISLDIQYGEVHALLGENGAGKSTLVSILYGLLRPDSGVIERDGIPLDIRRPSDAIRAGVGLVQQHFSLVPEFTVLENIILGDERSPRWRLNLRRAGADARRAAEPCGLDLPWNERVRDLPPGVCQRAEIAKALYRGARVMLFDEPTASLAAQDAERFLETLSLLKSNGAAVLLITHRLPDAMRAADRVTVLRRGKVVLRSAPREAGAERIASAVVGGEWPAERFEKFRPGDTERMVARDTERMVARDTEHMVARDPVFSISNLRTSAGRVPPLGVCLEIRAGEILGLAGVAGNGQTELMEAILGILPAESGTLNLDGHQLNRLSTRARRAMGIAPVPQDRFRHGLLPGHSLVENAYLNPALPERGKGGWIKPSRYRAAVDAWIRDYNIAAPSASAKIDGLSGGNQQRFLLARELGAKPRLILAHDPARGLDIRAARFAHEKLLEAASNGAAVLLISPDLDELFLLAGRIGVLCGGRLTVIRPASEWTPESLGMAMTGGAAA